MSSSTAVGPEAARGAAEVYGVGNWGAGYFSVNARGNLAVSPLRIPQRSIDLLEVVEQLAGEHSPPFLLRFPQILDDRLADVHQAFRRAAATFDYGGRHLGVYPVKVNQKADVLDRLIASGRQYDYGLEVGSKAELMAALAAPITARSLIVCNGLKDEALLRAAVLSEKLGKRAILVVEDLEDALAAIEMGDRLDVCSEVGIRVKLYSRGSGKWERSGGEFAKFGMSTVTLVRTLKLLESRGQADRLRMLHFHIGSQITDLGRAKRAFKEAARVYAKVRRMGFEVEFLNVGGGLGVDYDGSKSASAFSVNYSVQEFADEVVGSIGEVCASEGVPCPTIVTEAGRAVAAYHAVLVSDVKKVIRPGGAAEREFDFESDTESDAEPVRAMADLARGLDRENFRASYHAALERRGELNQLFDLGRLGLEDKACGERLFWRICREAVGLSRGMKQRPEEFEELERLLASKYVLNFSMFESLPDFWAFGQLFPILPIHRLHEWPTERGVLCDVTCDSDGAVDRFVDVRDVKETLELHRLNEGEPYYLACLLIGAYQETLGDMHNLFGEANEASVSVDETGRVQIEKITRGDSVRQVLEYTGQDADALRESLARQLSRRKDEGLISGEEEYEVMASASLVLDDYTYLT